MAVSAAGKEMRYGVALIITLLYAAIIPFYMNPELVILIFGTLGVVIVAVLDEVIIQDFGYADDVIYLEGLATENVIHVLSVAANACCKLSNGHTTIM